MNFIGRAIELKKLKSAIDSKKTSFTLIYGRRRIGKSELIKFALKQSKVVSIYYECKETAERSNVESLCDIISDSLNLPKLGFSTIEETLDYLFRQAINQKIVVVLDEYPYLRENIKGMDSIVQSLLDRYRDSSKLSLVLLGSYIGVMKSLIEEKNPLYGRTDAVIDLKPMDYYDSAKFYPAFSSEDKVRIYSVFGGVPYYNSFVNDKQSVKENIIRLIASSDARFGNEVPMYLKGEISKIKNANEVFEALAKGYSKYSDILSQSHVSSGPTLADVLERLISMEVIKKVSPINDEHNKKRSAYYISDNLSLFYYKYVYRYASQMSIMDSNTFYKKYIEKQFESEYVPSCFEEICRQYLIRMNVAGKIRPVIEKIGKYYYDDPITRTNGEFDVVTQDKNGYIFYEVKFKNSPFSKKEIMKEIEQVEQTGLSCYKYMFITRAGIENADRKDVGSVKIDKLYK